MHGKQSKVQSVFPDDVRQRQTTIDKICLHVNYFNEFRFAGREKYER